MRTFGGRSAALLWCACSFPCRWSLLCTNCVRCLCQHLAAKPRRVVVDAREKRERTGFSLLSLHIQSGGWKNEKPSCLFSTMISWTEASDILISFACSSWIMSYGKIGIKNIFTDKRMYNFTCNKVRSFSYKINNGYRRKCTYILFSYIINLGE